MAFKHITVLIWFFLSLALSCGTTLYAQSTSVQTDKATQTRESWDEMMHYALIGRWDLAQGYGQALLQSDPDPVLVLDLAQSEHYAESYKILELIQSNTPLKSIAEGVLKLVEEGRFRQRTDVVRIADEVKRLSGTTRGRMLAVKRLKDSGEWSIPVMIQALRDPDRSDEYTYIRWALPQIGKAAVAPLVVVLQKSSDLNIRLIVLEALGKIGYKSTLPHIQQIIESDQASDELKSASVNTMKIISPRSPSMTAARRFENLAEAYYNHVTSLKVAANQSFGTVWFWNDSQGLSWEDVPRDAFDEL
ncbi:MAG: HEAT repeat domain-containing protein, partial [Planctomycetes bacterium]|nr:HEAT repeat domain-containing protein [Planctomycetota bacterium]